MEQKEKIRAQKSALARMQIVHLGRIAFNLEFVALVFCLASVLSFMLTGIYYLFLIIVSFGTIGIIYLIYPEFASWWNGGETLAIITNKLFESWPYVIPITVGLSLISIICLSFDQNKKQSGRIIGSIIVMVIALVILLLILVNNKGGNA